MALIRESNLSWLDYKWKRIFRILFEIFLFFDTFEVVFGIFSDFIVIPNHIIITTKYILLQLFYFLTLFSKIRSIFNLFWAL